MSKKIVFYIVLCIIFSSFAYAEPNYGNEWNNINNHKSSDFSDVGVEHWAYDAITRVVEKNWFNGYPNGKFKPDATISRGEALKVFVVFLGLDINNSTKSSFYDVDVNEWYSPYIEAGKELFPVRPTIQGKVPFQPDMPVTREDTVFALVKALGYDIGVEYSDHSILNMFKDSDSISKDMKKYFTIALEENLISGFPDDTIRAQDSLTRAEFATLLYRGSFKGNSGNHKAKIESISVSHNGQIELELGETFTLKAIANYTDGTNKEYTDFEPYVSSGNNIIKINGKKITAIRTGKATIKYNNSLLEGMQLKVVVTNPSTPPKLKITDFDEVTKDDSVTIKGVVTDESNEDIELTCNNKDVIVMNNGNFSTTVKLSMGKNTFKFVATNVYGIQLSKSIEIERLESIATELESNEENITESSSSSDINSEPTLNTAEETSYETAIELTLDENNKCTVKKERAKMGVPYWYKITIEKSCEVTLSYYTHSIPFGSFHAYIYPQNSNDEILMTDFQSIQWLEGIYGWTKNVHLFAGTYYLKIIDDTTPINNPSYKNKYTTEGDFKVDISVKVDTIQKSDIGDTKDSAKSIDILYNDYSDSIGYYNDNGKKDLEDWFCFNLDKEYNFNLEYTENHFNTTKIMLYCLRTDNGKLSEIDVSADWRGDRLVSLTPGKYYLKIEYDNTKKKPGFYKFCFSKR